MLLSLINLTLQAKGHAPSKAASPASSAAASPPTRTQLSPPPLPAPPSANVALVQDVPSEQTPKRSEGPSLLELAVRRQHLQEMRLGHIIIS